MTSSHDVRSSIHSDAKMISSFVETTLASLEGWLAVRAFAEKGAPNQAPRLTFHPLRDDAGKARRSAVRDAIIARQARARL